MVTTDISTRPFFLFNRTIEFSICLLLGSCTFNALVVMFGEKLSKKNVHIVINYINGAIILSGVLYWSENAIIGVAGLFMSGGMLWNELVNMAETRDNYKVENKYNVLVSLQLFMYLLCGLVLPFIILAIPFIFTSEKISHLHPISLIMFFWTIVFYLCYNTWCFIKLYKNTQVYN